MKYYIFLLFLLGVCILLSFVPKRREGLTSAEQIAEDNRLSIKTLEDESLQLVRDARSHEASVKSSPLDNDANKYKNDTVDAYQGLMVKYDIANKAYTEMIVPRYNSNPTSESLKESKQQSEASLANINAYMEEAKILAESAKTSAAGPRPTSAGYTRGPTVTTPSNSNSMYSDLTPISTVTTPSNSMYSDLSPSSTVTNRPSNRESHNTTAPLNNASPTIPVNSIAPTIGITTAPVKYIEKHYDWETWEPSESWEYVDFMNGISEKVDKKILNEKEDGFVKYATQLKPEREITLNTSPEVVRKNEIIANDTIIDYFKHLFKTYSEPFKTNVVLTDVNTNQTYDLRRNQEIYNEKGEVKFGKYDDTDYDGFIRAIELKKNQLEKEKKAICNDTIKCIADFDTQIGDKLCCGQKGTLKDTMFVCPENKPTCGNFKCDSNFGVCS